MLKEEGKKEEAPDPTLSVTNHTTQQTPKDIIEQAGEAALSVTSLIAQQTLEYDTVEEVGEAVDWLNDLTQIWGPGTLFKPNGRMFTRRTPKPFPHGPYTYKLITSSLQSL